MKNYSEFCNKKSNKTLEPKIYIACLAAYNNGFLHGNWVNANQDTDDLYLEVKKILKSSPIPNAEEFAIHDYEDFGDVQLNEYTGLEEVSSIASFISEHDEFGAVVLGHTSGDIDEASRLIEECYHGEYDSEEDFASSFYDETMIIPDHFSCYIDYKKMARDLFINDFFSIELNHKVHIFSNC